MPLPSSSSPSRRVLTVRSGSSVGPGGAPTPGSSGSRPWAASCDLIPSTSTVSETAATPAQWSGNRCTQKLNRPSCCCGSTPPVAALVLGVGAVVAEADPVPSPGSAQAPASSSSNTRSTERAPQPAAREACEDDEVDHQDMDASARRLAPMVRRGAAANQAPAARRWRIATRRAAAREADSNRAQNNVGVFGSMPRSAS